MAGRLSRRLSRSQLTGFALLALLVLVVNIAQPFPAVAPLHHIPTVALIVSAPLWLRRWPLGNAALFCLLGFFALHSFGARWTYTNVPYDDLLRALADTDTGALFGWTRNHYDRLVHFAFGGLMVLPVMDWLRPALALKPRGLVASAVVILLAVSAGYELFEWLLTFTVPEHVASDYNGQQGDLWDAQKDMALALLGSLAAAVWLLWRPPAKAHINP